MPSFRIRSAACANAERGARTAPPMRPINCRRLISFPLRTTPGGVSLADFGIKVLAWPIHDKKPHETRCDIRQSRRRKVYPGSTAGGGDGPAALSDRLDPVQGRRRKDSA